MPDVAISCWTTGDPHVAIAPRDDVVGGRSPRRFAPRGDGQNKCVGILSLLTLKPKVYNSVKKNKTEAHMYLGLFLM